MPRSPSTRNASLSLLKKKRREWLSALSRNDPSGIESQIESLCYDVAMQSMLSGLCPGGSNMDRTGKIVHPYFRNRVWYAFRDSAILRIRKVTEKPKQDPAKAVNSIVVLLECMKFHAHLMTRENLLKSERLRYTLPHWSTYPLGQRPRGDGLSEYRHELIDKLTGRRSRRSKSDQVPTKYFQRQIDRIEKATRNIGNFGNKFIMHSATPQSRKVRHAKTLELDFGGVLKATQAICQVFTSLRVNVLFDSCCTPVVRVDPHLSRSLETAATQRLNPSDWIPQWNQIADAIELWFKDESLLSYKPNVLLDSFNRSKAKAL